jgi:hypothetical protein
MGKLSTVAAELKAKACLSENRRKGLRRLPSEVDGYPQNRAELIASHTDKPRYGPQAQIRVQNCPRSGFIFQE